MKLKQYIKAACLFSFMAVTISCMNLEPLSDLGDNLVWNNATNFQLFANQFIVGLMTSTVLYQTSLIVIFVQI